VKMAYDCEFSLVIPFYNEEQNAEAVLKSLSKELDAGGFDYEIVAVDNGSRDATPDILKSVSGSNRRVKIATIGNNEGYGWGITNGFRSASGRYVGFMCGDGQISPSDVARVLRRINDEHLDFCKVKRVVRRDGLNRKLMSVGYNILLPLLFGIKTADINGTPKVMKRELYDRLDIRSKDWFIDTEMMVKVQRLKARTGEVEVEFLKRERGRSNVRFIIILEFLKNLLRFRLGST